MMPFPFIKMPSVCYMALYGSLFHVGGQDIHGWLSSQSSDITFWTFCVFPYSCVLQDATHLICLVPEMFKSPLWSKSSCFFYVSSKIIKGPIIPFSHPVNAGVGQHMHVLFCLELYKSDLSRWWLVYFPKALLLTHPCCWVQTVSLLFTVICILSYLKQGETVDVHLIFLCRALLVTMLASWNCFWSKTESTFGPVLNTVLT